MTRTITLSREDINNPLHPNLFDQICEQLGITHPNTEQLILKIVEVEAA